MLNEAVDTILEGMERLMDGKIKESKQRTDGKLATLGNDIRQEIKDESKRLEAIIKDETDGLKAELSKTVSRKEFNELKGKVDKYHPLN